VSLSETRTDMGSAKQAVSTVSTRQRSTMALTRRSGSSATSARQDTMTVGMMSSSSHNQRGSSNAIGQVNASMLMGG
jgi:hypothetical protein